MKIIKFDPILMRDANRALETAPYSVKEDLLDFLDVFPKNTYIAYSLGSPVGIVCSDIYDGKRKANFSVYVSPKYRRRGIGKALFMSVYDQAKKTGIKSLVCNFVCDSENALFVTALGFEKRYSSHFMTRSTSGAKSVLEFETYDDNMFFSFVEAEANAFYPMRHRLGIEPEMIVANENMRSFLAKAKEGYFVYRKNGEVLAGGGIYNGEIADVFVSEKLRGQGIGKRIVERCIFEANKRGLKDVSLWVISENLPAFSLYTSLGFKIEKTHDYYFLQVK